MSDVVTAYRNIKQSEAALLAVPQSLDIDVGAFDLAGSGPTGRPRFTPPTGLTTGPVLVVAAARITLQFRVAEQFFSFRLTVNGKEIFPTTANPSSPAPAPGTVISADVGFATSVTWVATICYYVAPQTGAESILELTGTLQLRHAMAGAFTLPALPIALLYALPQRSQRPNQLASVTNCWLGARFAASFADARTDAARPMAAPFTDRATLAGQVTAVTNGARDPGLIGALQPLQDIASELASLTGGADTSSVVDLAYASGDADFVYKQLPLIAAGSALGDGDIFVYLADVRVAWLDVEGATTMTVLGFSAVKQGDVALLRRERLALSRDPSVTSSPTLGLDVASIDALLALDPFAAQRRPDLSPNPGNTLRSAPSMHAPSAHELLAHAPSAHAPAAHAPAAHESSAGDLAPANAPVQLEDPRYGGRFLRLGTPLAVTPGAAGSTLDIQWPVTAADSTASVAIRQPPSERGSGIERMQRVPERLAAVTGPLTLFMTARGTAKRTGQTLAMIVDAYADPAQPYQLQPYADRVFGWIACTPAL